MSSFFRRAAIEAEYVRLGAVLDLDPANLDAQLSRCKLSAFLIGPDAAAGDAAAMQTLDAHIDAATQALSAAKPTAVEEAGVLARGKKKKGLLGKAAATDEPATKGGDEGAAKVATVDASTDAAAALATDELAAAATESTGAATDAATSDKSIASATDAAATVAADEPLVAGGADVGGGGGDGQVASASEPAPVRSSARAFVAIVPPPDAVAFTAATDLPASVESSSDVLFERASRALHAVENDPTSVPARRAAKALLLACLDLAGREEIATKRSRRRTLLRCRFELAVLRFQEAREAFMAAGGMRVRALHVARGQVGAEAMPEEEDGAATGTTTAGAAGAAAVSLEEELLALLSELSDPALDPFEGNRRPKDPEPSPWRATQAAGGAAAAPALTAPAPMARRLPLAEADEVACMAAQVAFWGQSQRALATATAATSLSSLGAAVPRELAAVSGSLPDLAAAQSFYRLLGEGGRACLPAISAPGRPGPAHPGRNPLLLLDDAEEEAEEEEQATQQAERRFFPPNRKRNGSKGATWTTAAASGLRWVDSKDDDLALRFPPRFGPVVLR